MKPQATRTTTHRIGRTALAPLLSASLALGLAACANGDTARSTAPATTTSTGTSAMEASANTVAHDPAVTQAIADLNATFAEAEANTQWQPGYYRDVYTRITEQSQKLVSATTGRDNPQLELDATILNEQAKAMLAEEPNFEQEKRPAQLENRYTRADMQLWRDRLAFALENRRASASPPRVRRRCRRIGRRQARVS